MRVFRSALTDRRAHPASWKCVNSDLASLHFQTHIASILRVSLWIKQLGRQITWPMIAVRLFMRRKGDLRSCASADSDVAKQSRIERLSATCEPL